MNKITLFICTFILIGSSISCKKGPGEGGSASIKGYVKVLQYNPFFTIIDTTYDGADEDVYIIYGDDISYGERIRSSPDGKFEFKFLREGNYKVYVYSEESRDTFPSGQRAVEKEIEITEKKQTVDAGTFEIKKN